MSWDMTIPICACDCEPVAAVVDSATIKAGDFEFLSGPAEVITGVSLVAGTSFPAYGSTKYMGLDAERSPIEVDPYTIYVPRPWAERRKVRIRLTSQGAAYIVKYRILTRTGIGYYDETGENPPYWTWTHTYGELTTRNVASSAEGVENLVDAFELPMDTGDGRYWQTLHSIVGEAPPLSGLIDGHVFRAEFTKAGFTGYRIDGNAKPKIHLTEQASGSFAGTPPKSYSGKQEYAAPRIVYGNILPGNYSNTMSADVFWKSPPHPLHSFPDVPDGYLQKDTGTIRELKRTVVQEAQSLDDILTLTLSNEFTTQQLIDTVSNYVSDLETAGAGPAAGAGSYPDAIDDLSADEVFYARARSKYRIQVLTQAQVVDTGQTSFTVTAKWQIVTKNLYTGQVQTQEETEDVALTPATTQGWWEGFSTERTLTAIRGRAKWIKNVRVDPLEQLGDPAVTVKFDLTA